MLNGKASSGTKSIPPASKGEPFGGKGMDPYENTKIIYIFRICIEFLVILIAIIHA